MMDVGKTFLSLVALTLLAAAQTPNPKGPVVAVVNGTSITEDELGVQSRLLQIQKTVYDVKMQALRNLIARKVLEQAASERHLSLDDYLKQQVDDKVPEPGPGELEGFYLAQRQRFNQPFASAREQVKAAWKDAKIQELRQALAQDLLQGASIRVLLEPPRNALDIGQAPRRGGSAPGAVTIVEFSDYQCPYCKRVQPTLREIAARYGDKVSFVFKNFPLDNIHPEAMAAAEAAQCAGEQGKFWPFHDALFEASPALKPERILAIARQLQLNEGPFRACVDSRKYQAAVDRDRSQGESLGVAGTPAFFVNGVFMNGAAAASEFERVIDTELKP